MTIGLEASQALEALHRVGLCHGDVSTANIMIVDGVVILVDAWGELMPDEAGTAAYAAPERASEGPSPASDVYALGMVLRDIVSEAGADRLEAWTAPMVAPDPQARPPMAMVARALPSCAEPTGVEVPRVGVAAAVRARAQGPTSRTERLDSGRAWRAWRAGQRAASWTAMAAGAAVVVVMAVGLVQRAAPLVAGDDEVPVRHVRALHDHALAAVGLTHARFEALADADGPALMATTVPGSPAAERAEAEALALSDGEVEFSGLSVAVDAAETVAARHQEATVFVEYTVSAHQVRDGDRLFTYESYSQSVEMSLSRHADQWQVRQVRLREPPTGTPR